MSSENASIHELFADTATPVRHNTKMRSLCQERSSWLLPLFLSLVPFIYNGIVVFVRPRSVVMTGCVINKVTDPTRLNAVTRSLLVSITIPFGAYVFFLPICMVNVIGQVTYRILEVLKKRLLLRTMNFHWSG